MAYGIQIFNNNGKLMFDTSKTLSTYVLKSVGSASSVSVTHEDILFINVPTARQTTNNNRTFFVERSNYPTPNSNTTQTFNFKSANPVFSTTKTTETLNYFIITPSKNVSSSDDYGFIIYDDDGSTVQFDSRAVTTSQHFQIEDSHTYPDVGGSGNYTNVSPVSQYISVSVIGETALSYPTVWTYYDNSSGDTDNFQIAGWRARSDLSQNKAGESDIETEEDPEDPLNPIVTQFFPRIESQILIGTLIGN